jgi:Domain of unknown function (DUF4260)
VIVLLRLEGAVALGAGVWLWGQENGSWLLFVPLLLLPDLSMLGYLRGPAVGALIYNAFHTWTLAGAVILVGWWLGAPLVIAAGAIFLAHSGGDRLLGYGLKYPTAFRDTHLGRIGRG